MFFPLDLTFLISFHRVGIDFPEIEVRYENLTIEADAYIGSRALPTFTNFITNFLEVKYLKENLDFESVLFNKKNFFVLIFGFIGYVELSPYSTESKEEPHYS